MVIVFCDGGFVTVSADVWVQFVPVLWLLHAWCCCAGSRGAGKCAQQPASHWVQGQGDVTRAVRQGEHIFQEVCLPRAFSVPLYQCTSVLTLFGKITHYSTAWTRKYRCICVCSYFFSCWIKYSAGKIIVCGYPYTILVLVDPAKTWMCVLYKRTNESLFNNYTIIYNL